MTSEAHPPIHHGSSMNVVIELVVAPLAAEIDLEVVDDRSRGHIEQQHPDPKRVEGDESLVM